MADNIYNEEDSETPGDQLDRWNIWYFDLIDLVVFL